MTNITFEKLSRTAATGNPPQSGSRGLGKQYNSRAANVILLPSRSILAADVAPLEPIDLAQARLKEAIPFALPVGALLWILIGLAVWGLISVFL